MGRKRQKALKEKSKDFALGTVSEDIKKKAETQTDISNFEEKSKYNRISNDSTNDFSKQNSEHIRRLNEPLKRSPNCRRFPPNPNKLIGRKCAIFSFLVFLSFGVVWAAIGWNWTFRAVHCDPPFSPKQRLRLALGLPLYVDCDYRPIVCGSDALGAFGRNGDGREAVGRALRECSDVLTKRCERALNSLFPSSLSARESECYQFVQIGERADERLIDRISSIAFRQTNTSNALEKVSAVTLRVRLNELIEAVRRCPARVNERLDAVLRAETPPSAERARRDSEERAAAAANARSGMSDAEIEGVLRLRAELAEQLNESRKVGALLANEAKAAKRQFEAAQLRASLEGRKAQLKRKCLQLKAFAAKMLGENGDNQIAFLWNKAIGDERELAESIDESNFSAFESAEIRRRVEREQRIFAKITEIQNSVESILREYSDDFCDSPRFSSRETEFESLAERIRESEFRGEEHNSREQILWRKLRALETQIAAANIRTISKAKTFESENELKAKCASLRDIQFECELQKSVLRFFDCWLSDSRFYN